MNNQSNTRGSKKNNLISYCSNADDNDNNDNKEVPHKNMFNLYMV
jgi:hypothetical protein